MYYIHMSFYSKKDDVTTLIKCSPTRLDLSIPVEYGSLFISSPLLVGNWQFVQLSGIATNSP